MKPDQGFAGAVNRQDVVAAKEMLRKQLKELMG
jgi:hypothetical protein